MVLKIANAADVTLTLANCARKQFFVKKVRWEFIVLFRKLF